MPHRRRCEYCSTRNWTTLDRIYCSALGGYRQLCEGCYYNETYNWNEWIEEVNHEEEVDDEPAAPEEVVEVSEDPA